MRYKDDRKSVFYGTITDVVTGTHPDNDPYSCPNSGVVSTIAALQNGCSYCGTRLKMDELFPKITSYYFLEDAHMTKKEFLTGFLKFYPFTAIGIYIMCCILKGDVYLPWNLLTYIPKLIGTIFGIGFGSIPISYVLFAYFLFIRLIVKAISNGGKMRTAGARSRFESSMKIRLYSRSEMYWI